MDGQSQTKNSGTGNENLRQWPECLFYGVSASSDDAVGGCTQNVLNESEYSLPFLVMLFRDRVRYASFRTEVVNNWNRKSYVFIYTLFIGIVYMYY